MKNNEQGSAGLAAMASILALTLATFYVKNTSDQSMSEIKTSRRTTQNSDTQVNNLSNLALLRGLVNASKGPGTAAFQPAIYAAHYFEPTWTYLKNPNRQGRVELDSSKVAVKSFQSERAVGDAASVFNGTKPAGQVAELINVKHLEILSINHHPTLKHLVTSIDVRSKNTIASKEGSSMSSRNFDTVARIPLLPPEPGPVTLEIKPDVGGTWGTNFGTATAPLPPGKYRMRMKSSGVVYYGKIKRDDGPEYILGLKDGVITHKSDNILATNEEIGTSEVMDLGITEEQVKEETKDVTENAVIPATSGTGSGPKIIMAGCNVQLGVGAPTVESTSSIPTTTTSSSSSTATTSVATTVPSALSIQVTAYGVDEKPAPDAAANYQRTVYVTKTVVTKTTTTVNTTKIGSSSQGTGEGPGYDNNNCRSMCPMSTDQSLHPDYFWTMFRDASDSVADKKRTDFYEPGRTEGGLQQGLGVKGVVCANLELVADKIEADTGLANVADLKNAANNSKWPIFDADWNSGAAKPLERFYAYTAPSCARQFVGERGACGCFEKSTLIRMADGSERPVSAIRQGDAVWNPKTSSAVIVARVVAGPEKPALYAIMVGGNTVRVTNGHPFLTPKGLVPAKQLTAGQTIIHDNMEQIVESVTIEERDVGAKDPTVWNFELEGLQDDDHYVLANGIMTGDLYLQLKLQNSGN